MRSTLRERALRLLSRREHARHELARKLATHAESEEEIQNLLNDLSARGLLSDERYVEMRLNSRAARFGNERLGYELRTQGVSEELINIALASSQDEFIRAQQVWQRKFGSTPETNDHAERARQTRFMMNRGFSGETIRRILRGDFENE